MGLLGPFGVILGRERPPDAESEIGVPEGRSLA